MPAGIVFGTDSLRQTAAYMEHSLTCCSQSMPHVILVVLQSYVCRACCKSLALLALPFILQALGHQQSAIALWFLILSSLCSVRSCIATRALLVRVAVAMTNAVVCIQLRYELKTNADSRQDLQTRTASLENMHALMSQSLRTKNQHTGPTSLRSPKRSASRLAAVTEVTQTYQHQHWYTSQFTRQF